MALSDNHPLSDHQMALDLSRMDAINAGLASQNELNQGAHDALDRRMDSINAGLASNNSGSQESYAGSSTGGATSGGVGGLLAYGRALHALNTPLPRLPDDDPLWSDPRLTTPFRSETSYAQSGPDERARLRREARISPNRSREAPFRSETSSAQSGSTAQADEREREALSREALLRREALIIDSIIPAHSREASFDGSGTSYAQSGPDERARLRREARISPNRSREAPFRTETSSAQSGSTAQADERAREARSREAHAVRMEALLRRQAHAVQDLERAREALLRREAVLPSYFSPRAREARSREARTADVAHRRDTRTFHVSIPNSELASQNQTMNLSSQQAGPAGHFHVTIPRIREAFRRDTNAPDVDQFNAILTQLAAERDLQNV